MLGSGELIRLSSLPTRLSLVLSFFHRSPLDHDSLPSGLYDDPFFSFSRSSRYSVSGQGTDWDNVALVYTSRSVETLYLPSSPPLSFLSILFYLHTLSFSSVATVHSFTMVGIDIIVLLAGAVGLATANPVKLDLRQSGASTTSPPWYPARTFFSFSSPELSIV